MAHEVIPHTHSNLAHLRVTGNTTYEDMTCDEELGLNEGRPIWILLDVTQMNIYLPQNFLNSTKRSFFMNRNTQHLAVVVKSGLIKSVAMMAAKISLRGNKLSLFDTVEEAEAHLITLIKKQGF